MKIMDETRPCEECGKPIPADKGRRYCSTCALVVRQRGKNQANYRWSKNGDSATIGKTTRNCAICGKPFVIQNGRHKYCPQCKPREVIKKTCELCGVEIPSHRQKYCEGCAVLRQRYLDYIRRRKARWPLETPIDFKTWLVSYKPEHSHRERRCIDCGAKINALGGRKYCAVCAKARKKYHSYKIAHGKSGEDTDPMTFEEWKENVINIEK